MTNRNSAPISHQQIIKKSIQVAGHYSAHIGLAPSFKLTGLQIFLQSGSIIITDMLHRPVLLPHILSDFSRSMPLLQCHVSTLLHVHSKKSRHIFANLPSGSAYPHVLYAKIFSCQGTWCIRTDQRMERDTADRLLCNFKSQYFRNQLCF